MTFPCVGGERTHRSLTPQPIDRLIHHVSCRSNFVEHQFPLAPYETAMARQMAANTLPTWIVRLAEEVGWVLIASELRHRDSSNLHPSRATVPLGSMSQPWCECCSNCVDSAFREDRHPALSESEAPSRHERAMLQRIPLVDIGILQELLCQSLEPPSCLRADISRG